MFSGTTFSKKSKITEIYIFMLPEKTWKN